MMRGLALMRGATSAISRSSADMAAPVHLSSTSMAFSHSMTMVTAGRAAGAAVLVDFLAISPPNIGSAGRQASPLMFRNVDVGPGSSPGRSAALLRRCAVLLEVEGAIHDILR